MGISRIRSILTGISVIGSRTHCHSHKLNISIIGIAVAHRRTIVVLIRDWSRIKAMPKWHAWANKGIMHMGSEHISILWMWSSWSRSWWRTLLWVGKSSRGNLWTIIRKWLYWKATRSNRGCKRRTSWRPSVPDTTRMIIYRGTTPRIIILMTNIRIRIQMGIKVPLLHVRPQPIFTIHGILSPPRICRFNFCICLYRSITWKLEQKK
jgi:hypothetical protein